MIIRIGGHRAEFLSHFGTLLRVRILSTGKIKQYEAKEVEGIEFTDELSIHVRVRAVAVPAVPVQLALKSREERGIK